MLLQNSKDKNSLQAQLQQLQLQQQQIVQQMQVVQGRFLLANGLVGLPGFPPAGQGQCSEFFCVHKMHIVIRFARIDRATIIHSTHNSGRLRISLLLSTRSSIAGMTPTEMQALWKEVQQAQALAHGVPPPHAPPAGGDDSPPKSLSNGVPTPPTLHTPPTGHVPNGVSESLLLGEFEQNLQVIVVSTNLSDAFFGNETRGHFLTRFFIGSGGIPGPAESVSKSAKDDGGGGAAADQHALYRHGVCQWPGCEEPCDSFKAFQQ